MKIRSGVMAGGLLLALASGAWSQDGKNSASPDNTTINKRDRAASEPTADQAKDNTSDREIMRKIRRSVVADKSLSTYGHNVKIIAEHGKVTLKGPVHSEEESRNIEARATEVAGAGNVTNQLSVMGDKSAR